MSLGESHDPTTGEAGPIETFSHSKGITAPPSPLHEKQDAPLFPTRKDSPPPQFLLCKFARNNSQPKTAGWPEAKATTIVNIAQTQKQRTC